MGGAKRTETVDQTQTTTPQPTAEETELNRLDLDLRKAGQEGLLGTQKSGLELINQLLKGGSLPGFLSTLPGGISPETVTDISQEAVKNITPFFQQGGLLDSGVRASVSGQVAGDVGRTAEEFNIGNLQNLLSLALSGQSSAQSGAVGLGATLGQRLAGLRPITQTGLSSTTRKFNPFSENFQSSFGNVLGGGAGGFALGFPSGFLGSFK